MTRRQILESDFEVGMLGVGRDLFDSGFSDITCEGVLYVAEAGINVVRRALGEHFDGAIKEVADVAGQAVTICDIVSGETEADALDSADEDYTFCGLAHFSYFVLRINGNSHKTLS
jgi:hypothetical protein